VGYKVALCERDMAIYGAILLFGIIYALTGRRIKPLHWMLWLLLGLGPIGLDGFSQLFSQMEWAWLASILPYRESTPFLRVLTVGLFGLTTAWFPLLRWKSPWLSRHSLSKNSIDPTEHATSHDLPG
jgi:uncharacterized membrane protein